MITSLVSNAMPLIRMRIVFATRHTLEPFINAGLMSKYVRLPEMSRIGADDVPDEQRFSQVG